MYPKPQVKSTYPNDFAFDASSCGFGYRLNDYTLFIIRCWILVFTRGFFVLLECIVGCPRKIWNLNAHKDELVCVTINSDFPVTRYGCLLKHFSVLILYSMNNCVQYSYSLNENLEVGTHTQITQWKIGIGHSYSYSLNEKTRHFKGSPPNSASNLMSKMNQVDVQLEERCDVRLHQVGPQVEVTSTWSWCCDRLQVDATAGRNRSWH